MPFEFHMNFNPRVVSTLTGAQQIGMPIDDVTLQVARHFLNGTAAGQIDVAYARRRSVASGATDTIDINGVTNDAFNNNIAMLTLCGIILINEDTGGIANTTNLTLGGGANAIANILGNTTATMVLRPGGIFMNLNATSASGVATVTPGTADIITITLSLIHI